MPKVTAQEIKDLGFTPEMFQGQTLGTFDDFLEAAITEQSEVLEGRIGSTRYADATKPRSTYVKRAEKALVQAELWDRRMTTKLAQAKINGEPVSCNYEKLQRNYFLQVAEDLIDLKIIVDASTDSSSDFASGVLTTSHYDSDAGT